jgi:hypothetical protein
VSTTWWLVVVWAFSACSFVLGFAVRHEMELWNRMQRKRAEMLDFTQRKIGL